MPTLSLELTDIEFATVTVAASKKRQSLDKYAHDTVMSAANQAISGRKSRIGYPASPHDGWA